MKEKFNVTGMTCSACSSHVEKAVRKLNGLADVSVNLLQNSMVAEYDSSVLSPADIIKAVTDAGYGASQVNQAGKGAETKTAENPAAAEAGKMKKRLIWSAVFLVPLLYIAMGPMVGLPVPGFLDGMENAVTYGMAQFLLTLPILYLNRSYYEKGFKSLIRRAPTMDALIAIGSSAAVVYGIFAIIMMGRGLAEQDFMLVHQYHMDLYFESAGTILTLITVGKYMESRSKGKTSDAITRLMNLAPKTAIVLRDGIESEIPVAEVAVGDIVIVKTGGGVPVDGVVVEGTAAIDESAITGESIPSEKTVGDSVTGATVNQAGFVKIEAKRVGEDTTLSQIIRLVEDAGASKAPIAKLADKVSGVFVPIVIGIAVVATIIWLLLGYEVSFALSLGIAVLVISCPCALGLATPTAIMVGTGKGAEYGVLFKNAESIETMHTLQTVILDKTGTVTEGKPAVTDIYPAGGMDESELLQLAGAVEKLSEHPLAEAIVRRADREIQTYPDVEQFTQVPGQGIRAEIKGSELLAGNLFMMQQAGVADNGFYERAEAIAAAGKTPLFFARDKQLIGLIAVADTIKPTSAAAVAALQEMGMKVILLTGDNSRTANAIAKELGIAEVISDVLPQDKEKVVKRQQEKGEKVAMIGDGINDAPALMRADIGVAIGAGTDIAIESADVVLMKSDLQDAVTAIKLSHATIRNIKQNLFWAFFYNAMGIPLAAGLFYPFLGWKLSPMFGSAAMSLSSLFVVSNALRLRFFKPASHRVKIKQKINHQVKGATKMKLTMKIEGMMCAHCKKHVEEALNKLSGVTAEVDLENGTALVSSEGQVDTAALKAAVTEAGYQVVSIN